MQPASGEQARPKRGSGMQKSIKPESPDEWGRDPAVQGMRRVFQAMERMQARLLKELQVEALNPRLRNAREVGRTLFERAWGTAARSRVLGEAELVTIYAHCLAYGLERNGIPVSKAVLPADVSLAPILREILP